MRYLSVFIVLAAIMLSGCPDSSKSAAQIGELKAQIDTLKSA